MQGGGQRLALLPDRTLMLLSEITASTSRRDGSESDDAALIRLMADPLLLRDHLVESSETDSGGVGPIHRLGQRLLSEISFSGGAPALSVQVEVHDYCPVTPGPADSLRPEPFIVTGEDKALALENSTGSCRETEGPWAGGGDLVSSPVFTASLQLLLVVLVIAGFVAVLLH